MSADESDSDPPTLTDTLYDPDDPLRGALRELFEAVSINHTRRAESEPAPGVEAVQEDYTASIEGGRSIEGTRTTSGIGHLDSLEGHLGFAAGVILGNALIFGEPTLLYLDESPPTATQVEQYQDLTAEWYYPQAVDAGVPDARLESRAVLDATHIELEQIERYAEYWLLEK